VQLPPPEKLQLVVALKQDSEVRRRLLPAAAAAAAGGILFACLQLAPHAPRLTRLPRLLDTPCPPLLPRELPQSPWPEDDRLALLRRVTKLRYEAMSIVDTLRDQVAELERWEGRMALVDAMRHQLLRERRGLGFNLLPLEVQLAHAEAALVEEEAAAEEVPEGVAEKLEEEEARHQSRVETMKRVLEVCGVRLAIRMQFEEVEGVVKECALPRQQAHLVPSSPLHPRNSPPSTAAAFPTLLQDVVDLNIRLEIKVQRRRLRLRGDWRRHAPERPAPVEEAQVRVCLGGGGSCLLAQ
jgi:hypothetical protein